MSRRLPKRYDVSVLFAKVEGFEPAIYVEVLTDIAPRLEAVKLELVDDPEFGEVWLLGGEVECFSMAEALDIFGQAGRWAMNRMADLRVAPGLRATITRIGDLSTAGIT